MKNEAAFFLVTTTTLNFYEQKKVFHYYLESSTPIGLRWYTVMPLFSGHHNG